MDKVKNMKVLERVKFKNKEFTIYEVENEPFFSLVDLSKCTKVAVVKMLNTIKGRVPVIGRLGGCTLSLVDLVELKTILSEIVDEDYVKDRENIEEFILWFSETVIPIYKQFAIDKNMVLLNNIKKKDEPEVLSNGEIGVYKINYMKYNQRYYFKAADLTKMIRGMGLMSKSYHLGNYYKYLEESERVDYKSEVDTKPLVWITLNGLDKIIQNSALVNNRVIETFNELNKFVEEDHKYTFNFVTPVVVKEEVMQELAEEKMERDDKVVNLEVVEGKKDNQLQVIEQREILGKEFKMYGTFENPLFLAKDVAEWIEHNKPSEMTNNVDEDEKLMAIISHSGQKRNMWFLTEDGLYEVLMQSRKPIAKQFKKQVKKLLKELRTGKLVLKENKMDSYMIDNPVERAKRWIEEFEEKRELEIQVEELKPKVKYLDTIMSNSALIGTTIIAKDYGMSCAKFNKLLHDLGVQYKSIWYAAS